MKKLIQIVIVFVLLFSTVSSFSYAAPRIGLALGEGGERFYIHIGVLKALRDEGIRVDYIAGTSIGALIGGLYALWEGVEKIEEYILNLDFNKYYMSEREEVDPLTNWASFEYDLKIPFKAVATDLITGEKVVIDKGKICNAIAASMSVPGLFIPFEFEDKILVDGGLVDPIPVDVVREMGADIVIGVNLRDVQEDTLPVVNNVVSILYRSVYIMLGELDDISANKADIIIKPYYRGPLSTGMEKENKIQLIKLGEEETKKIIPLLKKLINSY